MTVSQPRTILVKAWEPSVAIGAFVDMFVQLPIFNSVQPFIQRFYAVEDVPHSVVGPSDKASDDNYAQPKEKITPTRVPGP
jgi:hypothetical protein